MEVRHITCFQNPSKASQLLKVKAKVLLDPTSSVPFLPLWSQCKPLFFYTARCSDTILLAFAQHTRLGSVLWPLHLICSSLSQKTFFPPNISQLIPWLTLHKCHFSLKPYVNTLFKGILPLPPSPSLLSLVYFFPKLPWTFY